MENQEIKLPSCDSLINGINSSNKDILPPLNTPISEKTLDRITKVVLASFTQKKEFKFSQCYIGTTIHHNTASYNLDFLTTVTFSRTGEPTESGPEQLKFIAHTKHLSSD